MQEEGHFDLAQSPNLVDLQGIAPYQPSPFYGPPNWPLSRPILEFPDESNISPARYRIAPSDPDQGWEIFGAE